VPQSDIAYASGGFPVLHCAGVTQGCALASNPSPIHDVLMTLRCARRSGTLSSVVRVYQTPPFILPGCCSPLCLQPWSYFTGTRLPPNLLLESWHVMLIISYQLYSERLQFVSPTIIFMKRVCYEYTTSTLLACVRAACFLCTVLIVYRSTAIFRTIVLLFNCYTDSSLGGASAGTGSPSNTVRA
jgi:hypothetical protein